VDRLTREVGESGLAADEGGRCHGSGLCCAGAETGAQGGSCAEESRSHCGGYDAAERCRGQLGDLRLESG
jgi:hypothetical protein